MDRCMGVSCQEPVPVEDSIMAVFIKASPPPSRRERSLQQAQGLPAIGLARD